MAQMRITCSKCATSTVTYYRNIHRVFWLHARFLSFKLYLCTVRTLLVINKIVKPCSRLSTALGPCLCNISWIQANWFKQYHARKQHKNHVTLTFDLWPWYSIVFWSLSRYTFVQNFANLSAAIHELSCWQRENLATMLKNNTAVSFAGSSKAKYYKKKLHRDF